MNVYSQIRVCPYVIHLGNFYLAFSFRMKEIYLHKTIAMDTCIIYNFNMWSE